jgi:hypothetical protein
MRKILEMDWDARNQNKTFKTSENVYKSFYNSDLALDKWKYISKNFKVYIKIFESI